MKFQLTRPSGIRCSAPNLHSIEFPAATRTVDWVHGASFLQASGVATSEGSVRQDSHALFAEVGDAILDGLHGFGEDGV